MDRKRVTQVVDPRAASSAAVGDAGLPQEPAEVLVDVDERQRLAGRPGKNQSAPVRLAICAG